MRASLASATSLLALLLLEGPEAWSTPSVTTIGTQSFGDVLVTSPKASATATDTATISGITTASNVGYGTFSAASGEFSGGGTSVSNSQTGTFTPSSAFVFAPTSTGAATTTINAGYVWSGGSSSSFSTLTLTGTGVAPVASGPATGVSVSGYYLVGGPTGTASLTVSNTGNGYLASATPTVKNSLYNLNGSISGGNSVFTGTAASISLQDSNYTGTAGATSATYSYTFAPTIKGVNTATVVTTFSNGGGTTNSASAVTTTLSGTGVAPVESVANSTVYGRYGSGSVANGTITVANTGNANLAGSGTAYNLNGSVAAFTSGSFSGSAATISLASNATPTTASTATSTLGYTYTPGASRSTSSATVSIAFSNGSSSLTNLSQSVAATLTGQAVGPTLASTLAGASVANTPTTFGTGTVAGTAGATINFGSVSYKNAATVYLELANVTTDANGGNALLTDLSIDAYSITGANASSFSVAASGSVITEGGMLLVPITVISQSLYGTLNSSLTIFTDEGSAFGGYGENFTYALTALSVPEPAALALLGAGLAGLTSFRRRRRAVH